MNKTELIAAIAEKTAMTKKDVEKTIKAYEEVVTEELAMGGKIQSVGFGTFEVTERKEREGRNPKTKEKIMIPASKSVKFKVGKALKEAVNC